MVKRKRARGPRGKTKAKYGLDDENSKRERWTVSIALPGSIIDNHPSRELRAYLAGQIARAATVFSVNEIVVFDDQTVKKTAKDQTEGNTFLCRLLQFAETPQYLRRTLFAEHPDLRFSGLLNPVMAPHHPSKYEKCKWREGVAVGPSTGSGAQGTLVNVGLNRDILVPQQVKEGARLTVRMRNPKKSGPNEGSLNANKRVKVMQGALTRLRGEAVSPDEPAIDDGVYWGYNVRFASDLSKVWTESPYKGGYDYVIGTSENGDDSLYSSFELPKFRHLLIVFGGVEGLEVAVDACEELPVEKKNTRYLFDRYLNACIGQGSKTIRTEEAVLITLSLLRPHILRSVEPRC